MDLGVARHIRNDVQGNCRIRYSVVYGWGQPLVLQCQ